MGCFSGCLMSSAGIQKLFCGFYSAFKCSFDEFVGEKVISRCYSSTILGPPPARCSLEGLMLKLQYFGHLMQSVDSLEKTLMLGGLGAGGEGDDRG